VERSTNRAAVSVRKVFQCRTWIAYVFSVVAVPIALSTNALAVCPFNASGNPNASALVDGLLLARVAQLAEQSTLTAATGAPRSALEIAAFTGAEESKLDVDGNGAFELADAAIIARYLAGFRTDALVVGSVGAGAKRTNGTDIQSYIDGGCVVPTRKKWSQHFPTTGGVLISVLDDVDLDVDVNLDWLEIQGRVYCEDKDLSVTSKWIMVHGGRLQCGTPIAPHTKKLTFTLNGTNPYENVLGLGMGSKVFGAMHGSMLRLYGAPKRAWTRLQASAAAGSNTLNLADLPTGWQIGDTIAVAPSGFKALEAEHRTITAINGSTVSLDRALTYAHWGEAPDTYGPYQLDMRAEVGNLTRNIVVKSSQNEEIVLPGFDPTSFTPQGLQNGDGKRLESGRFGGHMMFMRDTTIQLQNIEVTQMGQQGMLGRYPVHWHLNQDSSRNSFIRNSSVHGNFQRGIVVHQSNGIDVSSNVLYDIPGHAVFIEDGIERDNVFVNNLVMRVTYVLRKHRLSLADPPGGEQENRAERQAGFWITHPQNTFRGNVVAGVENGWGYIYADVRSDKIPVVPRTLATFAANGSMLEFKNNVAHSVGFVDGPVDGGKGVFNLGYGPEEAGSCFRFDERGVINAQSAVVSGVTGYKCRNAALWSTNFKPVVNSVFADSRSVVVNNQGESDATQVADSLVVSQSRNNPPSPVSLDFGPFPGPTLYEFLEAGPVEMKNVLAQGDFKSNDNSTPALLAPALNGNAGFKINVPQISYLYANNSTTVAVTVDRSGGYTGAIDLSVAIPKAPNLAADNPYYYVTSDALTIPAGANSAMLTLRNGAHPKSGGGQIAIVAKGNGTIVNTVALSTATAPVVYANAATGNNVARLYANTGSPRNPALSQMEFNRNGGFAVDGDLNSYAHASSTPLPWWQLDLERLHRIKEIQLRASATVGFGDVWVLVSDFPVFTQSMTLQEALALPASLVRRYDVAGAVGGLRTIALPTNATGRVFRVWSKNAGELKIPEIAIITQ
jgi:G8 domain